MKVSVGSNAAILTRLLVALLGAIMLLIPVGAPAIGAPNPRINAEPSRSVTGDPPAPGRDSDGDGFMDGMDECPETRRDAVLVGRGCSVLQSVIFPRPFLTDVTTAIRVATRLLRGVAFDDVLADLKHGREQIGAARSLLGSGEVCRAATTFDSALGSISDAVADMEETVVRLRDALMETGGSYGDADWAQDRWVDLGYWLELTRAAEESSRDTTAAFARVCQQVDRDVTMRDKVVRVDDGNRTVELANGRVFGLPPTRPDIDVYEGGVFNVDGVMFEDGSGIARTIENLGGDPSPSVDVVCLGFRFAPYQPFGPPLPNVGPSYVLHHPSAYKVSKTHQLEDGMRVGAESLGKCGENDPEPGSSYNRRSFRLYIEFKQSSGAAPVTQVMAYDLKPGDAPVKFPGSLDLGTKATMTVIERATTCVVSAPGKEDCKVPVDVAVDEYVVNIGGRRAQCRVEYSKTELDLDEQNPDDFRNVEVVPLTELDVGVYASEGSSSFHFEAKGYKPGTHKVVTRKVGQPFSIYHNDFYSGYDLYAEEYTGVTDDSGLMWPRLKGTRNGHTFWYMCRVPEVVRDVVDYCDPDAPCYYRLPWAGGDSFSVTQGNNTTHTHKGKSKYAFDFGMPEGEFIEAARGGRVIFVEESLTENCDPDKGEPKCPANVVRIKHQDGTIGGYGHMPEDGVFVEVGDEVQRGDVIAKVGNTGYSTGPHLHFVVKGSDGYSRPITFEAESGGVVVPCLVPKKDQKLSSTNL